MKRIFIYFNFLTILSLRSNCQNRSFDTSFIKNDSITFEIIQVTSTAQMDKSHVGKFGKFVDIPMNADTRDYLEKKDSVFWIAHLKDDETDWATNLVLYYLYEKDATILAHFRSRQKWLPLKAGDIQFWIHYFRNNYKENQPH
jgi:hypothetical protein